MKSIATIATAALLLTACGATSKQLELCYARADVRFGVESERLCPTNQPWEACAEAKRLEGEHWQAYTRCIEEAE